MSHVAHSPAPTARSFVALVERLEIRARSVRFYQRISEGDGVLARIGAIGKQLLTRLWKARSATQTPSAFERLGEEVAALHTAGVPDHQLRLAPVALHHLIDDLDAAPTDTAKVLAAIATAQREEAEENLAEAALLCRADRAVTEADLDRLIDEKGEKVAADQHALALASKLRRQLRAARRAAGSRSFTPHFGGMAG